MIIKIKLSTGKEIELTKEEFDELYSSKNQEAPIIPYYPFQPYHPNNPPFGWPTVTYGTQGGAI